MGKALSKNSERGRKAFALAGQRIYIMGLNRNDIQKEGVSWNMGVIAAGATTCPFCIVLWLSGCINIPKDADMLAGICLMAGPVNQNDIGKQFYGYSDLLAGAYPGSDPTSLLVWTLKAKTIADPIGNEEQLMNASRKGHLLISDVAHTSSFRLKRDQMDSNASIWRANQSRAGLWRARQFCVC